ncbi:MAG: hypothetical protein QOJ67_1331 [Acidimicrobiaceae bacterium]|jgi:hypothetical protein
MAGGDLCSQEALRRVRDGRPVRRVRHRRARRALVAIGAVVGFGAVVAALTHSLIDDPASVAGLVVVLALIVAGGVQLVSFLAARHPEEPWLFRMLMLGLAFKLVATYARYLTNVIGYESTGDATEYDRFGKLFANAVVNGIQAPDLATRTSTNFIRWLTGWVYVVTGPQMLVGYFVFGFAAFWGSYLWYRAAAETIPNLNRRRYLMLLLFVPSVVFWPSSIGKESVLQLALGLCAFGVARLLYQHWFVGGAVVAAGAFLVNVVRPHLFALFAIAFACAFVLGRLIRPRPPAPSASPTSRFVLAVVVVALSVVAVSSASSFLGLTDISTQSIEKKLQEQTAQTSQGGSEFNAPEPSLSPTQLPIGLLTVFFRPLPYEAHGPLQVISALENSLLLLFVLVRIGSLGSALRNMRRFPFILFSTSFVLMYAATYSSFANFGLLARQRTLAMPPLLLLLCIDRLRADEVDEPVPLEQAVPVDHRPHATWHDRDPNVLKELSPWS